MTINRLSELGQKFMDYDVIGVDACQFFVDLVEFTEKAANNGKIVIVSSLQGTFQREAFPNINKLIPKCDEIKQMTTTCRLCKAPGGFTFRSAGNKTKKLLGGDNLYITLCRDCHIRESKLLGPNAY